MGTKIKNSTFKIFFLILTYICIEFCASTPSLKDYDGEEYPNSVTFFEEVEIGNSKQWILARGTDKSKPVLLFVHGGPGNSLIPLVRHYNSELEKHFVFVNWDQRGAGKSYDSATPLSSMNMEQMLIDVYDVVNFLRKKFDKRKIYIMGHSFGSALAILTAYEYPELFHAYIGIGQFSDMVENEKLSYRNLLKKAIKTRNKDALDDLTEIQEPPYVGENFLDKYRIKQEWLLKLGGVLHKQTSDRELYRHYFFSSEYSIFDTINWFKGKSESTKLLYQNIMSINLSNEIDTFDIPIYFLQGRHDNQTPPSLVQEFFHQIQAKHKEFIWFEKSAHYPMFEEAEEFNSVLIYKILAETYNREL